MLNPKDKVINRHKEAKENDAKSKSKGREYVNRKRQAKPSELKVWKLCYTETNKERQVHDKI